MFFPRSMCWSPHLEPRMAQQRLLVCGIREGVEVHRNKNTLHRRQRADLGPSDVLHRLGVYD
jgi:hypothetical protein